MTTIDKFLGDLRSEFPFARVSPKVGWFWTALHWIVVVVTFGTNRRFQSGF